jgi:D-amino-acid dehydrogenase
VNEPKVIVVGGGVIGVCTAYYLAQRGCAVKVLDKGDIGGAASFGNAGLISVGHPPIPRPGVMWQAAKWMLNRTSPLYIPPRLDPALLRWLWVFRSACRPEHFAQSMDLLAQLGHASIPLFEELIGGGNLSCDYRKTGVMEVFRSAAGRRSAEADLRLHQQLGFDVELLNKSQLRERQPALVGELAGAVWYKDHATCNPNRFVLGVAQRAAAAGVELCPQTEVTGFVVSNGRVKAVQTQPGEALEADIIVLSAGCWSTRLAKTLGVSVPLQPAKGYHRDLDRPEPCVETACIFIEEKVAATPMDDCLRLAGTLEFSGLNLEMRRERLEMLTQAVSRYLPGVVEAPTRSEWCGLRPCTADGLPVIGWAPRVGNVLIATGHAMLGLGLGPVTGKLASELILDGAPSIDIGLLRADRF